MQSWTDSKYRYGDSRMDANSTAEQTNDHQTGGVHSEVVALPYYRAFGNVYDLMSEELRTPLPSLQNVIRITAAIDRLAGNYKLLISDDPHCPLLAKHLAFTLLVPGGKAKRARKAVDALDTKGYFTSAHTWTTEDVARIIRPDVRFYNQKAQRLISGSARLDEFRHNVRSWSVREAANGRPNVAVMQSSNDWLRTNISGLGAKATAHFMRNVGLFSDTFAYPIIDVHIYRLLKACNFQAHTYKQAERSFQQLAKLVNIPVIHLDAYTWCAYSGNWVPDSADFDNFTQATKDNDYVDKRNSFEAIGCIRHGGVGRRIRS